MDELKNNRSQRYMWKRISRKNEYFRDEYTQNKIMLEYEGGLPDEDGS